jgi:hypothetical protein
MKYKAIIIAAFPLASLASWAADQKEKKGDDKMAGGQLFLLRELCMPCPVSAKCTVTMVREEYCPGPYLLLLKNILDYEGVKNNRGCES